MRQLLDPLALTLALAGVWLVDYAAELGYLLRVLVLESLQEVLEVWIE